MALLKRLGALLAFVAFAVAAGPDEPSDGPALDPYSIAPVPGDLVVNGGFEANDPVVTGWALSGNAFPWVTILTSAADAFSGNRLIRMGSPNTSGTISQTLSTVPAAVYIVNFHVRCRGTSSGNTTPNSFSFSIDGNQKYAITNDVVHGYVLHTYAFAAAGASTVISFTNQHNPSYFYLDDVSVVVLPVPCDGNFYEFDPLTGYLKAESGKIYPGPPQPVTTFPAISDAGQLIFGYQSDALSQTLPRMIIMGLAKDASTQDFDHTLAVCQFKKVQATGCPSYPEIDFVFSKDVSSTIQENWESLALKGCVTRIVASDYTSITFSGEVLTLYMDAYNLGNRWSELKPISFSMKLPYTSIASTTAVVDVVSDAVAVEYQPLEVINQGTSSNPIIQFTTIATTYYPFVAYGTGASYTPPSSSETAISDPSASSPGVCVLYMPQGQVASTTTACDSNPGTCTVQCTRIISLTAPACVLSGYVWEFDFKVYQDFSLSTPATHEVSDISVSPTEVLLNFDSNPSWDVCPTAADSDYARFIHSEAIHGHYDTSNGDPIPAPATPSSIGQELDFGFKIYTLPDFPGNPGSSSATKIYRARLTQLEVSRPDSTKFYLIGSSADPTIGGIGPDQGRTDDFTTVPAISSGVYSMYISSQGYLQPNFASSEVSFTPKLGDPSDSMLYYSDSSIVGGVTLTIKFSGVISLFADGSTPSKRDIYFRRQVTLSPNGTFADPKQVINSQGTGNSTTIVIEVPRLTKAINAATIAGSVVGGLVGLGLLVIAFLLYRRSKKATQLVVSSEKLETGSI